MNRIAKQFFLCAVGGVLSVALFACAVEVPGGVDDFRAVTATPSGPTVTPVIIAPALQGTPTRVPPPPTPTRAQTNTPNPTAPASTTTNAQPTAAATTNAEPSAAPTNAPTQSASTDTGEMIAIQGGTFTMGNNQGDADERPAHEVVVNAFQMDRFEVTNALFEQFVGATNYQTANEKNGKAKTWRTFAKPDTQGNPVVMVSWADAQAFCEWAGKRLPTEAEWEYAARGADGRIFPWGNDFDAQKFNGKASGIRGTTHVGSYPAGASAFGIEDMAGNVWEWTADWYQAYPGGAPSQFYGEKFRVTRGGGWFDEEKQVRATNRSSAAPEAANDDLGFRCVK